MTWELQRTLEGVHENGQFAGMPVAVSGTKLLSASQNSKKISVIDPETWECEHTIEATSNRCTFTPLVEMSEL